MHNPAFTLTDAKWATSEIDELSLRKVCGQEGQII